MRVMKRVIDRLYKASADDLKASPLPRPLTRGCAGGESPQPLPSRL